MSTSQIGPFQERVRRISRRHERIAASGARPKLTRDGLIVMLPQRRIRSPGLLRPLLLLVAFAFAGKVALYTHLGPEAYAARLAALDTSDTIGRAGAVVMAPDPATQWIEARIADLGL